MLEQSFLCKARCWVGQPCVGGAALHKTWSSPALRSPGANRAWLGAGDGMLFPSFTGSEPHTCYRHQESLPAARTEQQVPRGAPAPNAIGWGVCQNDPIFFSIIFFYFLFFLECIKAWERSTNGEWLTVCPGWHFVTALPLGPCYRPSPCVTSLNNSELGRAI